MKVLHHTKFENGYLLLKQSGQRVSVELHYADSWIYDAISVPELNEPERLPLRFRGWLGNWQVERSESGDIRVEIRRDDPGDLVLVMMAHALG